MRATGTFLGANSMSPKEKRVAANYFYSLCDKPPFELTI
jgi:hypothetical protein